MSKNRICPVCKNDIPDDAMFLCPHCRFELIWLDDEKVIEKAKKNFSGALFKVEKHSMPESGKMFFERKPFVLRYITTKYMILM